MQQLTPQEQARAQRALTYEALEARVDGIIEAFGLPPDPVLREQLLGLSRLYHHPPLTPLQQVVRALRSGVQAGQAGLNRLREWWGQVWLPLAWTTVGLAVVAQLGWWTYLGMQNYRRGQVRYRERQALFIQKGLPYQERFLVQDASGFPIEVVVWTTLKGWSIPIYQRQWVYDEQRKFTLEYLTVVVQRNSTEELLQPDFARKTRNLLFQRLTEKPEWFVDGKRWTSALSVQFLRPQVLQTPR